MGDCSGQARRRPISRPYLAHISPISRPYLAQVTWEIAPGKLADGSVAEVWRATEAVSWQVPEEAALYLALHLALHLAPYLALYLAYISWQVPEDGGGGALRHGRYRMFPFLGGAASDGGAAGARFWEARYRRDMGRYGEI